MSTATPRANDRDNLVEGEFAFTAQDFQQIAAILHGYAGISLNEGKAALVYSRLAKRLRTLGLRSFREYCALVDGDGGTDERQVMTAALTTNVTRYYREPHHFDHLRDQVLPALVARAKAGGRVRLWSAACSNGQEPYSMALVVLSMLPNAAELDFRILATDIDPNMVMDGKAGLYTEEHLEPVPAALRSKFFSKVSDGGRTKFSVSDDMRKLVQFKELNLIGHWPMKGQFDVIFCRNVVIYFDDPTQEKVWSRFTPMLVPGGTLYIGHSERVSGPATSKLRTSGLTTYQKVSA